MVSHRREGGVGMSRTAFAVLRKMGWIKHDFWLRQAGLQVPPSPSRREVCRVVRALCYTAASRNGYSRKPVRCSSCSGLPPYPSRIPSAPRCPNAWRRFVPAWATPPPTWPWCLPHPSTPPTTRPCPNWSPRCLARRSRFSAVPAAASSAGAPRWSRSRRCR